MASVPHLRVANSLGVPVSSAHVDDDEPSGEYPVVRPKTIGRTTVVRANARERSAALLDAALLETGVTTAMVSRVWDVDEKYVRKVRTGEVAVSQDKIEQLPAAVHEAMHRRRTGNADHHAKVVAKVGELVELLKQRRGT